MEEQWQDILLPRQTLEEVLGEEIAKQYRLRWGQDCAYMPVSSGTECLCTCGKVNPAGEVCAACKRVPKIPSRQELETLQAEATQRLEQEAALRAQEEAERLRQEAEQRKRKRRRILTVCAAVVGALAVVALVVWSVVSFAIPAYHYGQARKALEQKNYQLAHREFLRAGEYKDAKEYLSRFYTPELTARMDAPKIGSFREYTYDPAGRLIKEDGEQFAKDGQGDSPTTFWWGYVRENDEDGRLTLYETASERREYFYDHRGDLTRAVVYDKEGNLKNSYTFLRWYDEEERLTEQTARCMSHSLPNNSFVQTDKYAYDEEGRMIWQETTKDYPQKPNAGYVTTTCWCYDAQGRMIEKTTQTEGAGTDFGNITEEEHWAYDEAGNVLTHRQKTAYAQDPASDCESIEHYTYDGQGRLTSRVQESRFPQDPERFFTVRVEQEYDRAGNQIWYSEAVEFADPERNEKLAHSWSSAITYDLWGRPVKEERAWNFPAPGESFTETETTTYSINGVKKTSCTETKTKEEASKQLDTYDENGLLSERQVGDEKAQTRQEYTYAYFYFEDGVLPAEFVDPLDRWTPLQLYG